MSPISSGDQPPWGPIEWVVTALTTLITTVTGFVWGTRSKLLDHDRRIDQLESSCATDIRRLEQKVDGYHSEMTRLIMTMATRERNGPGL